MTHFNYKKYRPFAPIHKTSRLWPDHVLNKAPIWCSVDLRDGNQALMEPMSIEQKLTLFRLLIDVGFKQIEVGFPSASQVEYDFVRRLIDESLIPDDVTIQVLVPARQSLIETTFIALKGVKKAIVHLYNSTSTVQREQVFKRSKEDIKQLAVQGAQWIQGMSAYYPDTHWTFQYSPESFTGTELDYAVEVCDAVNAVWQPTQENPVIINLPSTVEMATPNVYADQIEWFCEHIRQRQNIIISLHTHNDRGCGIAAAELGLMAGADRLEGTLLGNGERTGNMDIVTCAMNLYSQGIDPKLNLADMNRITETVTRCTHLPVHPRHPYAGELVFAAFSGSHQDAINKCLARYKEGDVWNIAYLPIDPRDVGRSYEAVVRITSQSGKGGVAFVLSNQYGWHIPKWMQSDFGARVQKVTEDTGGELSVERIKALFEEAYLQVTGAMEVTNFQVKHKDDADCLQATLMIANEAIQLTGQGAGPLEAFVNAVNTYLPHTVTVTNYSEHAINSGETSEALAYVQTLVDGQCCYGVGRSQDIIKASFQALLNALPQRPA